MQTSYNENPDTKGIEHPNKGNKASLTHPMPSDSHSVKSPTFWWAITLGIGLALFPIHNTWLTELFTTKDGNTIIFIPTIATLLIIVATGFFIISIDHWKTVKANGWGDLKIVIPLGIIVAAIGLSGITAPDIEGKLAPLFMGLVLFALYIVSRVFGRTLFVPVGIGAGVASLGVIIYQAIHPGTVTGGYVFGGNYDIVAGYILLGSALFFHKWRIWLALLGATAMLLSGSPEALFSLAVVGAAMVIRRDLPSWKVLAVAGAVLVILGAVIWGTGLYRYIWDAAHDTLTSADSISETRNPISYRVEIIKQAITHIKPLGNGYSLTEFYTGIVHNVPLIIVQELGWPGILAGLAWLWITVYCLIKSKWKYAWILVLSLSVFDHFLWDQLSVLWPCIIGASLASADNDYILRHK